MSFFKKITDSVSKGVSTATEKAQQTVEITRLNAQVSGKRKDIEKLYAAIGENVFEAYLANDLSSAESKVLPICQEITSIQGEIETLHLRIKEIRNEKDCVCGKRLPEDTRFCPHCGHGFPEPEPAPAEESASIEDEQGTEESDPSQARADQRLTCNSCGTPLYADSHYCPACGQPTR